MAELDLDAIEREYGVALAVSIGHEMRVAVWTLMQHIPALIARVRELEAQLQTARPPASYQDIEELYKEPRQDDGGAAIMERIRQHNETIATVTMRERQRCLTAIDRVASGYMPPVYWAEKVRHEIEGDKP